MKIQTWKWVYCTVWHHHFAVTWIEKSALVKLWNRSRNDITLLFSDVNARYRSRWSGWISMSCQSLKHSPFYWFYLLISQHMFCYLFLKQTILQNYLVIVQVKMINLLKLLLPKYWEEPVCNHSLISSLFFSVDSKYTLRVSVTPQPEITHSVPLLKGWFGRQAVLTNRVSLAQYGLSVTFNCSMATEEKQTNMKHRDGQKQSANLSWTREVSL